MTTYRLPREENIVETIELENGLEAKVTIRQKFDEKRWGRNSWMEVRSFQKARVYVWVNDESIAENLMNRRNRPVTEYRKIAKEVLQEMEIGGKINWSQKAGCSCPCSPGFILHESDSKYAKGYDISIEVNAPELKNNGFVTPLENYMLLVPPTLSFEEAVAVDMAAC